MKGSILAVGLAAVMIGGVALLMLCRVHPSHPGPCVAPATSATSTPVTPQMDPEHPDCPTCRPTRQVFDVVNLKIGFGEQPLPAFVSFDEPPFAKQSLAVVTAGYLDAVREVLPPPRPE